MTVSTLKKLLATTAGGIGMLAAANAVLAAPVVYEHLAEANSNFISFHNATGPILADDFDPSQGGAVVQAEWWGSRASASSWELTLHRGHLNAAGVGEPIPVFDSFKKYFVDAAGTDLDGDGIFHFETALPGDFFVEAGPLPFGSEYWFSIANVADDWTWAFAGSGPTVGDEHWHAVRSIGDPSGCEGGPHCGPWNEIEGRDFAFRLEVVPEPSMLSLALVGGIAGFAASARSKARKG